jgi:hypothetical protein
MIRAVRDRRYKYIRHYRQDQPYLLWIPYRNRHPIVQEMWRLHLAGKLTEEQSLLFRPRPAEELYDTERDPWETENLAEDASHRPILEQLRTTLDAWMREVGDLGLVSESEMVRRWYPDGQQPRTARPVFVPICESNPGVDAARGGRYSSPVRLQMYCPTQGASIAYTLDGEATETRWLLYCEPVELPPGEVRVRGRAIRIGYAESAETSAMFTIT